MYDIILFRELLMKTIFFLSFEGHSMKIHFDSILLLYNIRAYFFG